MDMTNYHPAHALSVVPVSPHAVLAETSEGGSVGLQLPPLDSTSGALYLGMIFSIMCVRLQSPSQYLHNLVV